MQETEATEVTPRARKKTSAHITERDEARARLRGLMPPGSRVYTVLRQVARSGMSRHISVHTIVDGQVRDWTRLVAKAAEMRLNKNGDALVVGGCGMDMGFAVVYELSHALYPQGFQCIGRNEQLWCPSNDHSNGDRDYSAHTHRDGGYALEQQWI